MIMKCEVNCKINIVKLISCIYNLIKISPPPPLQVENPCSQKQIRYFKSIKLTRISRRSIDHKEANSNEQLPKPISSVIFLPPSAKKTKTSRNKTLSLNTMGEKRRISKKFFYRFSNLRQRDQGVCIHLCYDVTSKELFNLSVSELCPPQAQRAGCERAEQRGQSRNVTIIDH